MGLFPPASPSIWSKHQRTARSLTLHYGCHHFKSLVSFTVLFFLSWHPWSQITPLYQGSIRDLFWSWPSLRTSISRLLTWPCPLPVGCEPQNQQQCKKYLPNHRMLSAPPAFLAGLHFSASIWVFGFTHSHVFSNVLIFLSPYIFMVQIASSKLTIPGKTLFSAHQTF